MTKKVWVTNSYEGDNMIDYESEVDRRSCYEWMFKCQGKNLEDQAIQQELEGLVKSGWEVYEAWERCLVQGPPEPSDVYTIEMMEDMGIYGLYLEVAS